MSFEGLPRIVAQENFMCAFLTLQSKNQPLTSLGILVLTKMETFLFLSGTSSHFQFSLAVVLTHLQKPLIFDTSLAYGWHITRNLRLGWGTHPYLPFWLCSILDNFLNA